MRVCRARKNRLEAKQKVSLSGRERATGHHDVIPLAHDTQRSIILSLVIRAVRSPVKLDSIAT